VLGGNDSGMTVLALSAALDARDPEVRHHSDRVARYAFALGQRLGMEPDHLDDLTAAALLHDVGVLGIPDSLLRRRDPLLPHELDVMRDHSVIGARIVEAAGMPEIAPWIRHHHERIDGLGYPDRLVGDAIPFESRIIAVVEVLETITANRYQWPGRRASAVDELEAHKGTQFDARITDALLDLLVSGELEGGITPPLLAVTASGRIHDPEWVVTTQGGRMRLAALR
jgi:HD-GYP domain-containing protein (c-di-GMP phosphodiesterase class II)